MTGSKRGAEETTTESKLYLCQSVCAVCGRPVPAGYVRRGDAVYLEKNCPDHVASRVLASEDADAFERWLAFPSVTVPPRVFVTKGARGAFAGFAENGFAENGLAESGRAEDGGDILNTECPLHCGVCENHLMTACCVLLNVTARCNQHCPYCFAEAEKPDGPQASRDPQTDRDPSLADIGLRLDRLAELGEERKFNIQLSGGEPTVRDDLADIIRLCKAKGFEYVQLNTNGRRLAEDAAYAKALKSAGLSTVFLQFDGTDDRVCLALRGEPLFAKKQSAIRNCGAAGLPVTLVPTILKNVNLPQVGAILDFMLANLSVVKGVHFQPASFFGRQPDERNADGDYGERVTMFAVMDEIEKQTGGRVKKSDLAPISTGHPLCCFCAAFLKEADGALRPLSSGGACCGPGETAADGACCGTDAPDVPCCGPGATDPLEIIRRDRDFVLNKWDVPEPSESGPAATDPCPRDGLLPTGAMSFDEAIHMFKSNMFTISGMSFMDDTNLDAERLRRCRVQVFTEDERLVPFCGYYAAAGKRWQMSEKAWR
ncbi:MAG: radical SAM protein [Clostridiales Family XIII bacterium]|jgi:uncharacterized radical SAM superfamily Fe-S cluster-containing enzyme|nr:radical SAM protein [Clostridiales Family XIII bacterium]